MQYVQLIPGISLIKKETGNFKVIVLTAMSYIYYCKVEDMAKHITNDFKLTVRFSVISNLTTIELSFSKYNDEKLFLEVFGNK